MKIPVTILLASVVLSALNVRSALVADWTFNEGAGTNVADVSGHGNNGVIYNLRTNTWTTGVTGGAIYLDGTTGSGCTYVRVEDSASLDITSAISFAAWIREDDITRDAPIISKEGPGGLECYVFGAFGLPTDANGGPTAPGDFGVLLSGTGNAGWLEWGRDAGTLRQGIWTHLAVTWDGNTVRYYTNGVALSFTRSYFGQLNVSSAFLAIGENAEWFNTAFNGAIGELRIYNQALSPSEVAGLAAIPTPTAAVQAGVQISWPTRSGINYQPQWADAPNTNGWNNLGSSLLGNGTTNSVFDPFGSSHSRFYRIQASH
jgi:hypothetical protein